MRKKREKKETRNHIVKARLNDQEYYKMMLICQRLKITPSTMIRALLDRGKVHAVVYENKPAFSNISFPLIPNLSRKYSRLTRPAIVAYPSFFSSLFSNRMTR